MEELLKRPYDNHKSANDVQFGDFGVNEDSSEEDIEN